MPGEWDIPRDAEPEEEEPEELGPGDPDYDLSEAHGYMWEPKRDNWPVPPWVLVVISILVVVALILPAIAIILR